MSDNPFDQYREVLVPQGTLPLIRLSLGGCAYFDHSFVQAVIREMEVKVKLAAMGLDNVTASERLVLEVLKHSASGKD